MLPTGLRHVEKPSKQLLRRPWCWHRRKHADSSQPPSTELWHLLASEVAGNGHAERVLETENTGGGPIYYMPHHAVIRRDRETTKVRIVFDASSKSSGAISLNEALHAGPNLNPDVLDLLLQFRAYQIALTADVEKAFLQIVLDPQDRDSLRFLWYATAPKADEALPPIETWRMMRVPFGAKSSTFLLAATIRHHLQSVVSRYPRTASLLSSHFYVDDLVVGVDSVDEGNMLYRESRDILIEPGMKLVKWTSNDSTLWKLFQAEGTASSSTTSLKKVLGLNWDIDSDEIQLSMKSLSDFLERPVATKRYVLQAVSRIFDPLGYVAPFVVTAKILLQGIWLAKLQWDDLLPDNIRSVWSNWCQEVPSLARFRLPRKLTGATAPLTEVARSLHVFGDASTKAYGAAVYLVSQRGEGRLEACLLLAKTRVAPVKAMSLPRLELMGAVLASRLLKFVQQTLFLLDVEAILWTDSEVALHWIHGSPSAWKPFVRNRVAEIQSSTQTHQWRHCPGLDNPADLLTRGVSCRRLLDTTCWWNGPSWLCSPESWPPGWRSTANAPGDVYSEAKTPDVLAVMTVINEPILQVRKYSSFSRLLRVTSWVLRFVHNSRSPSLKDRGMPSSEEINAAEHYWIRNAQREAFGLQPTTHTSLRNASLFHDDEGILRMQGRLQYGVFPDAVKHPIVLPSNHPITAMIIRHIRVFEEAQTLLTSARLQKDSQESATFEALSLSVARAGRSFESDNVKGKLILQARYRILKQYGFDPYDNKIKTSDATNDFDYLLLSPEVDEEEAERVVSEFNKVISCDHKGCVSVSGKPIRHSSVYALVNYLLQRKTGKKPSWFPKVSKLLHLISLPKSRKRQQQQQQQDSIAWTPYGGI
ncbi:uncharacterized protein LOC135384853 [Ornithodoros turicata]|uniref:uncharacterized protein LOC135384853 n=1 Tax=Ornithodoros turicata TaxID=34597 RepID=UPI003139F008